MDCRITGCGDQVYQPELDPSDRQLPGSRLSHGLKFFILKVRTAGNPDGRRSARTWWPLYVHEPVGLNSTHEDFRDRQR